MTSKDVLDKLYSTPYNCEETIEDLISKSKLKGTFGDEIIEITKTLFDAIFEGGESVFVGRESETDTEEPEALICDGGATSSLSSSLLNCTDVTQNVSLLSKQPKGAQQW